METSNYKTMQSDLFEAIDIAISVEEAVIRIKDALSVDHVIYHSSKLGGKPHIDPYVRLTYSGDWIKRYVQMDYMSLDPVLSEGFSRILPFDWSELTLNDKTRGMLIDALEHGVGPNGFSVPVRGAHGHRSLFSITSSWPAVQWRNFIAEHVRDVIDVAHHLHKKALVEQFGESSIKLTTRELDCLFWTAEGKEARDVAKILGISRFTVRDYLKSARFKLDCVTSSQAVNKASRLGLLSLK